MEATGTEVENIVEGMNNVPITYPFENWPALSEPYNPSQREGPKGALPTQPPQIGCMGGTLTIESPEAVHQVVKDCRNNPIPTNPGTDASVPFCFETFVQEIGDLPDVRMGTRELRDDSDLTSGRPPLRRGWDTV